MSHRNDTDACNLDSAPSTGGPKATRPGPAFRRWVSPVALLWLAVGLLAGIVLSGGARSSHAEGPSKKIDIAYIMVVGEGPIARAWYDGAPSPGVPVQDALNHFAEKGYVVVRTTDALRNSVNPNDSSFAILVQRVR